MRSWLSLAEIAASGLPGLPSTPRGVRMVAEREGWAEARNARGDKLARPRQGRGGGLEFHVSVLPAATRATLDSPKAALSAPPTREDLWSAYDRLPEKKKAEAKRRAEVLAQVEAATLGMSRTAAVSLVASESGDAVSTIYSWFKLVAEADKADRLPLLAPRHQGGQARITYDEDLYQKFKSNWLRRSLPSWEHSYRYAADLAAETGVTLPPLDVLRRRVLKETPEAVVIYLREGNDALKAAFPHQTRDRSAFHATEAMVADTHIFDVHVEWPNGEVSRPAVVAISDLYSNKMLAYRVGHTETSEAVRLTFGDAFRAYGIPSHMWLDNGRAFASKQVTGGQPTRYRFKVREEDPIGMLTHLGVQVHWATPYHGQAKPIERSFRDFAGDIAKCVEFEGAYTGPNTVEKPANYGSRAVPLDDFLTVLEREVAKWNARPARRTAVCGGKLSFDDAFAASYAKAAIKRATDEQLRLCMLSSRPVSCAQDDGAITMMGNRYHHDELLGHRGGRVYVRFDPEDLHGNVYVYDLSDRFIAAAPCVLKAGFADVEAGRKHARARGDFMRAAKAMAKAEKRYTDEELARLAEKATAKPRPEIAPSNIVRPVFGPLALQARPLDVAEDVTPQPERRDSLDRLTEHLAARETMHLRVVTSE